MRRSLRDAFMIGSEFAYFYPPEDGSLHVALKIADLGWAEPHPLATAGVIPPTAVMVYAPENEPKISSRPTGPVLWLCKVGTYEWTTSFYDGTHRSIRLRNAMRTIYDTGTSKKATPESSQQASIQWQNQMPYHGRGRHRCRRLPCFFCRRCCHSKSCRAASLCASRCHVQYITLAAPNTHFIALAQESCSVWSGRSCWRWPRSDPSCSLWRASFSQIPRIILCGL